MADLIANMQAVAGAGGSEATYVEDVFSTYLYTGDGDTNWVQNGIALSDANAGESVTFNATTNTGIQYNDRASLELGTSDFTIEAFIYPTATTDQSIISYKWSNANSVLRNMSIYNINGGNQVRAYFATLEGGSYSLTNITTAAGVISLNNWYHIALERVGSTFTLYVNGTSAGSVGSRSGSFQNTTYPVRIGNGYSHTATITSSYQGAISNVRVTIGNAVYGSAFTVPDTPLTALENTVILNCVDATASVSAGTDGAGEAYTINGTAPEALENFGPSTSDTEGKGGLVWLKSRESTHSHTLYDTERGATEYIMSNATNAEATLSTGLTSFNSNGFTHGSHMGTNDVVSWTFAKAPKFFDVVTYTGDGTSSRAINHNLGSTPGCVIVKCTSSAHEWPVYHRGLSTSPSQHVVFLHLTQQEYTVASRVYGAVNSVADDTFTVVSGATDNRNVNKLNETYVAYLFAHNDGDGGFGENGDQDIIKCGSYSTTNVDKEVDLGFEPQWVLIKKTNSGNNYEGWNIFDNMRGVATGGNDAILLANESSAEDGTAYNPAYNYLDFTSTGFITKGNVNQTNGASGEFIYIAIRRGPMKTPESGTEVFALEYPTDSTANAIQPAGFPVDLVVAKSTTNTSYPPSWGTRMLGGGYLRSDSTAAFASWNYIFFDTNEGYYSSSPGSYFTDANAVQWMFRRAPGFFDVVAYEGNSSNQNVNHNLGSVPELMIMKKRSNTGPWAVYHSGTDSTAPEDYVTFLNTTGARVDQNHWSDTAPTSTQFTLGPKFDVNQSGEDYIAYLFATLPGVSKVGTYTGNGTGQTIDCGFSAGARFVLIKRTDGNSNWNLYDTERGIVAGNDPRLELDSTDAEDTGSDDVDPDSSGFAVTSDAFVNTNGASYAFLAIA